MWESASGLECQVLGFANVYGPRDRDRVIPIWLERASHGEPLRIFGGEQVIDFVWVGTAVQALLAAAHCQPTAPINVGSGAGVTLPHLAQRILEETGSASSVEVLPARDVEVVRFVADVTRMHTILDVTPDADPLAHLSDCLGEYVSAPTQATPRSPAASVLSSSNNGSSKPGHRRTGPRNFGRSGRPSSTPVPSSSDSSRYRLARRGF